MAKKGFVLKHRLKEISDGIDSLEKVILVNCETIPDSLQEISECYQILLEENGTRPSYLRVPFSAPLLIMYSSGTTGKPKCIVHSHGGTLLQHLKELGLHSDISAGDRVFYFTTCGWMMWNWLVSGLGLGSTVVLFDGSPAHRPLEHYLEFLQKFKITHWGTSPKFLKALEQSELQSSPLPQLKMILSTGAPLLEEQFRWVYQAIKADLFLCSISGGTDIISCFMLGNPLLPVMAGEIQCRGLGMDVDCFSESGKSLISEVGELVCKTPFVSMPVGFLGDETGEKFHRAYFERFSGVWSHGDFIEITSRRSLKVFGRSDATLNPGGVRIGTAEIYRQTEKLPFIEDSLCISFDDNGGAEIALFVKLRPNEKFSSDREKEIRQVIRDNTTPRHVPKIIQAVTDIPYTRSGKKMELVVTKMARGEQLDNLSAVSNPESIGEFRVLFENWKREP